MIMSKNSPRKIKTPQSMNACITSMGGISSGLNNKMMNEERYMRLRKISERLKKEYHAEKVILFGSYARGEAAEDSDVDILVVAPTNEKFFERMATVLEFVRDLYDGLALSPIVLRPEEVKQRLKIGDQFVQEILEKGVEV